RLGAAGGCARKLEQAQERQHGAGEGAHRSPVHARPFHGQGLEAAAQIRATASDPPANRAARVPRGRGLVTRAPCPSDSDRRRAGPPARAPEPTGGSPMHAHDTSHHSYTLVRTVFAAALLVALARCASHVTAPSPPSADSNRQE